MIDKVGDTSRVAGLFHGWQETMILSCLQGVMGHIYADTEKNPSSAMAMLGDFCFFAGVPDRELVSYKPEWCKQDFIIMTANAPAWFEMIEKVYGDRARKVSRYAIRKDTEFDRKRLSDLTEAVSAEYCLRMIDKELFELCRTQEWSRDFVSQYKDYEEYQRLGLGVVAVRDGEPVSGASSYSSYQGGIEIEIDTKKEHRRRGLATACGAELILKCLDRGLYPSWDAQNLWSVGLAEKLGYRLDREYTAYEIRGY